MVELAGGGSLAVTVVDAVAVGFYQYVVFAYWVMSCPFQGLCGKGGLTCCVHAKRLENYLLLGTFKLN